MSTGGGAHYRSNIPPIHVFVPYLRRNGYGWAADENYRDLAIPTPRLASAEAIDAALTRYEADLAKLAADAAAQDKAAVKA